MYSNKQWNAFDMKWDSYIGKSINWDFSLGYVSKTKISFSGLPVSSLVVSDIVGVSVYDSDWKIKEMYRPARFDMFIVWSELEILKATLDAADSFIIYTNIPRTKIALVEWDIEIGAIEIKDWATNARANVNAEWELSVEVANLFSEIQRDTITPTFASLTDTYVFEYESFVTATIVLTYVDSTKKVLSLVTKS